MMKEQERSFRLSDLEVGKIFDRTEAIVYLDQTDMITVVQEGGLGDHGKEYQIQKFMYDLIHTEEGKIIPHYNGRGEIYIDEDIHQEYEARLKKAGLWSEN